MATRHPQGLETLILDRKGTRSYDELSRACGGTPTAKRLHQLVTRPMKAFPDPDTIKGLSRGLKASNTDVLLAAARSLDIPVGEYGAGALVLEGAGQLPVSAQEAIITLSEELQNLFEQVPSNTGEAAQVTND